MAEYFVYFPFFEPQDRRKSSVVRGRGFIQRFPRFGRINKPKYCWCGNGIRPSVPCHHIREYRYAYGAVEPLTGDGDFLVLPYPSNTCYP